MIEKEKGAVLEKFRKLTSIVAPLDRANVDTDQIIPKQFLKRKFKGNPGSESLPSLIGDILKMACLILILY
ncbi:MAG: hypothetical protein CM1200mP39_15700 [Dehalococcoidia bacterium]|nr:MAG: hypothetical protein CM1200mP39_15700 [Dehalococcoidia bacterium]